MKSRAFFLAALVSLSAVAADQAGNALPAVTLATAKSVAGAIDGLDARSRAVRQEIEALGRRAAELDAFTVARGRAYVRLARAGLLPVGGGFAALVDHAARLERLRRALERDLTESESVARERTRLAAESTDLESRREMFEAERSTFARSHAAIAAAEERDEAFRRAFDSSYRPDHMAVYAGNQTALDGNDVRAGFAAVKGRLPFPLAGRAEISPAARPGGGPGLEMVVPLGSAVRAVYPGRVAYADDYPDFGRTVIVDHGESYFSVYAGFSETLVSPGTEVGAGDRLGSVGAGGTLYVELRRAKETLEPAPWFGI